MPSPGLRTFHHSVVKSSLQPQVVSTVLSEAQRGEEPAQGHTAVKGQNRNWNLPQPGPGDHTPHPHTRSHSCICLGEGPCHDPRLGKWSTLEVSSEPDAAVTNPMESGGVRVPFSGATPRYMFLWKDFPWTHLPLLLRESQLTMLWSPDPSSWLWC